MYCTRAQFRAMYKMPQGSNPSIVNVRSMAAVLHYGRSYAYATSKATAEHFTCSAAKDGHRCGIDVAFESMGFFQVFEPSVCCLHQVGQKC
jgi:chanoclavine-I dehydrogenase